MLCMVEMKLLDKCNSHNVKAAKLDRDDDGILSNMLCETSNLQNDIQKLEKIRYHSLTHSHLHLLFHATIIEQIIG